MTVFSPLRVGVLTGLLLASLGLALPSAAQQTQPNPLAPPTAMPGAAGLPESITRNLPAGLPQIPAAQPAAQPGYPVASGQAYGQAYGQAPGAQPGPASSNLAVPPGAIFAPGAALPAAGAGAPANPYLQNNTLQAPNGASPGGIDVGGAYGYNASPNVAPQAAPTPLPPLPSDFDTSIQENMPLSPVQIRKLHERLDSVQKAAATIPNPPKTVTGSISLSLAPGAQPGVVRPFLGMSTSIVLLDSTGAPWPVENFSVGNKTLFDVSRLDGPQGSTFIVSPLQMYGSSNLILKLLGNPTPVIIDLVAGQKVVDTRVEARVAGHGPNAQITTMTLAPGVDSRLLSVLDGVPPTGRPVTIKGDTTSKAWLMPNGRIWLRTRLNVVSPAPISFVSSADGTKVYELSANARILGMLGNQFITLDLAGCLQECSN
jgi:intracellular multiplication protein IcmK